MDLHPAVEERLARLAPDQRAAATAPPGPVLCVAPAGSGKTTTLVARICWLVAGGADPEQITAVTFNKRAADELGERLASALEPRHRSSGRRPSANVPRARSRDPRRRRSWRAQPRRSVEDVIRRLNGKRPLRGRTLRRLDDGFSRLKLDLDASIRASCARMLAEPEDELPVDGRLIASRSSPTRSGWRSNDALDFDDLVRRALAALQADAALLDRWRAAVRRCSSTRSRTSTAASSSSRSLLTRRAARHLPRRRRRPDDLRLAPGGCAPSAGPGRPPARFAACGPRDELPLPAGRGRTRRAPDRDATASDSRKEIRAGPAAGGELILAPDPGDELARARRLLARWLPAARWQSTPCSRERTPSSRRLQPSRLERAFPIERPRTGCCSTIPDSMRCSRACRKRPMTSHRHWPLPDTPVATARESADQRGRRARRASPICARRSRSAGSRRAELNGRRPAGAGHEPRHQGPGVRPRGVHRL